MKYGNTLQQLRFPVLLCLVLVGVVACGGGVKKNAAEVVKADAPANKATQQYLPVDTYDKAGVKLDYVATLNPYEQQTGRLNKESVASYIDARRAFKAQNYKKATVILEQLTQSAPSLSGPFVLLGDIAMEQQVNDTAVQNYERAIDVNPENVNAYLRLAKTFRLKGDFIVAQNTYAKALAVWKDFPEAHLNLATLYDLYFNEPLKAQQHMEAYQFLSARKNSQVEAWLVEIRQRTGVSYSIEAGAPEQAPPMAVAGEVE